PSTSFLTSGRVRSTSAIAAAMVGSRSSSRWWARPMRLLGSLLDPNEREVKQHQRNAQLIGELELEFDELGAAAIQAKADELRGRLADGEDLDDLLPECFALTRVAAK